MSSRGNGVILDELDAVYGTGGDMQAGLAAHAARFNLSLNAALYDVAFNEVPPLDPNALRLPFKAATSVLYPPTVTSGAWTLTMPTIASGSSTYAPTVANGTPGSVTLPHISAGSTTYAPTVAGEGGAPSVLTNDAVFWIDADTASAPWRGQKIANKGTTGTAINAARGSTTSGAYLNAAGDAIVMSGNAAESASIPDSAGTSSTSAIELVARVKATWSSATVLIAAKRATGQDWQWDLNGGNMRFIDINGGPATRQVSTSGLSDGTWYWVKVTANGTETKFFYAADAASEPVSWTQLGTTQASIGPWNSTATKLDVGGNSDGGASASGTEFKRFLLRSTIGGSIDADFNAASLAPRVDGKLGYTDAYGNPWTFNTTNDNSNAPLYLPHDGTNNYLYLPGSSSNYAYTPDSTALSWTSGTIDVIAHVTLSSWTGSEQCFASKTGYTSDHGWTFWVSSGGYLKVMPKNSAEFASTVVTGFQPGATKWVRAVMTTGSPNGTVDFYTSDNGSSWTQLGTQVTMTSITSYNDTGSPLAVGSYAGPYWYPTGAIHRVQVWNGSSTGGGTKVFDANFNTVTDHSSFTESSSNAATVTFSRAASGRKSVVVTRPVWLFGTDDYLEVPDHADIDMGAADSFSAVVVLRRWGNGYTTTAGTAIGKQAGTGVGNAGWRLAYDTTDVAAIADGTAQALQTQTKASSGTLAQIALVRDVSGDTLGVAANSTITTINDGTTATMANALVMYVGRYGNATPFYIDGEVIAAAVFRKALNSTELGQIATYYGVA